MLKGSKVLNPADKARKEARKKELKKNKKQRQQVRSSAIERRDPEKVMSDLEKLDRLEYDATTYQSINEPLYKDKRKRLKDTWSKILSYYLKEDPDRHSMLKKLELEYEAKHRKLVSDFEAIKAAQEIKIEDIFLPPETSSILDGIADNDPDLLQLNYIIDGRPDQPQPPGCPPGLPPDLTQLVEGFNKADSCSSDSLRIAPHPTLVHPPPARQASSQHKDKSSYIGRLPRREHSFDDLHEDAERKIEVTTKIIPSRSAVIESKPVLFKPRTVKLVPSSVRFKLKVQK